MILGIIEEMLYLEFFGNKVWRFLLFATIILIAYPLGRLINYFLNNYLIKWASKTKIALDEIFFRSLNPSVTLLVIAIAFYYAKSVINVGRFEPILSNIFSFLIVIPVVYFLIKFSTEALSYYIKGSKKKRINEAGVDLLITFTRIALVFIGILVILDNMGYRISTLLAGLGIGGLAFALAAQDVLKNFFAGIALVFDRTFNKGERIKFENLSGRIEELKLRTTKIRTYEGTLVTIPNAKLADNVVENVTKVPRVRVSQTFTLTYQMSSKKIKKAKEIIEKAILDEEYTDKKSYWIWFDNFAAYSLDVNVIYFGTLTMDDWPERAYFKERINFAIKEGFEKEKIDFAYPTQTIDIQNSQKPNNK